MVNPSNATNKAITWSVQSAGTTGATINENTLTTPFLRTVVITATIANGTAVGMNYTQYFTITISTGDPNTVFVDGGGMVNHGFVNLKNALDAITTAGIYTVKINSDQIMEAYIFPGTANREITLQTVVNPVKILLAESLGCIFYIHDGITFVLGSDITLVGRDNNSNSVVSIHSIVTEAKLIMKMELKSQPM